MQFTNVTTPSSSNASYAVGVRRGVIATFLAAVMAAFVPELSLAAVGSGVSFSFGSGGGGAGGIGDALCTIVGWFTTGGIGSAVASLAVIFIGIGAFFGKVTWGMALTTASGIFAIFGSDEIISSLLGGMGGGCGGGGLSF